MSSPAAISFYTKVERIVTTMCKALTMLSGALLIIAILLTCFSILGRSLMFAGLSSIPGDYEMVEMFCGLAVFAFMPFCQLSRGHISVDLLIAPLGPKAEAWTQLLGDIVITGLVILLSWRHLHGVLDKYEFEETSFILEIPIWWPYAIAQLLLILFALTCVFTVWRDIRQLLPAQQHDDNDQLESHS
jgi:TRAP-type C4-dicarboxylate transport system permease small subunit